MEINISEDCKSLGSRAAALGARAIRESITRQGHANIIVATGASQFDMLAALVDEPGIDWSEVTGFHLDEYIGMSVEHPASFRRYLWQRFVSKLPVPMKAFHFIDAEKDPGAECERLGHIINHHPIDVAFIGIGENAHIAFNDPPADFETSTPYLIVNLDEACRNQQLGEGWFADFTKVPKQAISMSVNQILRSSNIICSVPDARKSEAVKDTVEGPITDDCPASALQQHGNCHLFLDRAAAGLLKKQ